MPPFGPRSASGTDPSLQRGQDGPFVIEVPQLASRDPANLVARAVRSPTAYAARIRMRMTPDVAAIFVAHLPCWQARAGAPLPMRAATATIADSSEPANGLSAARRFIFLVLA